MSTLKDEEFQRSITSLNRDFLAFITKHLEISPNVDLVIAQLYRLTILCF